MEVISIIGAGWLGLALGKELAAKGHKVHGTTTSESKLSLLKKNGLQAHQWCISKSRDGVLQFLNETDILVLNIPPGKMPGTDRIKLKRLLGVVRHAGVRKVIYISSTSVYASEGREVKEDDARRVKSSNSGYYMLDLENVVRNTLDIQSTILRMGGLYGPDRHPGRWMEGRKQVPGPENPVNMIHLQDCIGIITAVITQNSWGETYNAVSPEHPNRREFYAAACKAGGYESPTWSDKPAPWKEVNSSKLMAELNYTFIYPDPIMAF